MSAVGKTRKLIAEKMNRFTTWENKKVYTCMWIKKQAFSWEDIQLYN